MIDTDTCMAQTILNLLLSFCVVTCVGALCCIFAVILSIFDACAFQISQNGKEGSATSSSGNNNNIRPCFTISKICVAILGWPMIGLLIAIAVMTYSKKCKTEARDLYSMLHVFLITQLVTIPVVLVLAMCVSCCAQCCCSDHVRNGNNNHYKANSDSKNEYLLLSDSRHEVIGGDYE